MKLCPHCLHSSGIVADGKGTKCSTCNGKGELSNKKFKQIPKL